ncbi:ABC transporter permease [Segetibacter koreensis]|uniref:ABC transporter permease n=1 Tax=Segetibacter koreensis TaxID=398037 RepID=UPI00036CBC49|nr:ABC transporter permease [Segetibacter koreensis]
MIRNYLKIAVRNLLKYKFISFINLFGLSVGLTCCLLITTYILNELSYDRYNKNAENIYRVERTFLNPETKMLSLELGSVAPPFGPLLENDFKEIKKVTRLLPFGTTPLKFEDKIFNEKDVFFADENLFDVFDFKVTRGNPAKALYNPYSVMLTEETAKKYFGNDDPMNKVIRFNNQFDFKVTGIYKSLPPNAHFHPEIMLSFNTLKDTAIYGEKNLKTNWSNNSFLTYLLLPPGYNPKKLEAQFPAFQDRYIRDDGPAKFKTSDFSVLNLKKLTDIHLYSHKDDEVEINGDIKRVYIFSAIALFVLLIACINYMNLSTARSVLRAKEIGVRKVAGARKGELIAQFLSESVFVSCVATILAFALTWSALPWLNDLSGQKLVLGSLLNPYIILVMLLVPFIVGIVAGIYPALFLSSFQPIKVLKGILKVGGANVSFRKVLVVFQFSISIILIIATGIVFQQLHFIQNKSLGFDKNHVLQINNNAGLNDNYQAFKTELLANANIKEVGLSSRVPTGRLLDANGSQINRGDSLAPTKADIKLVRADADFLPAYGIKIVAGRNFYKDTNFDTSSFLINEAAVKALGLKSNEEAIGKQFQYGGRKGTLAGVFNDFHFESLHQRILPVVLFEGTNQGAYGNISIKITGNVPAALAHIERTWKKFLPEIPYQYNFVDERYSKLYDSEKRQGTIFTIFSCIAILIACLGLFGLSAFTITQRIKEIGIRKVLGASVSTIVGLLSKDFLKLVLVAAVIAFPVAWYAMNKWLEDFAYRINIPVWVFIVAACIAAIVAFATISFQAIKAATTNPVKNLRTE